MSPAGRAIVIGVVVLLLLIVILGSSCRSGFEANPSLANYPLLQLLKRTGAKSGEGLSPLVQLYKQTGLAGGEGVEARAPPSTDTTAVLVPPAPREVKFPSGDKLKGGCPGQKCAYQRYGIDYWYLTGIPNDEYINAGYYRLPGPWQSKWADSVQQNITVPLT